MVYKVVSRNCLSHKIIKKRVYANQKDFDTYAEETIKRYNTHADVEIYKMSNDEWELDYKLVSLCNKNCSACLNFSNYRNKITCRN